MRRIAKQEVLGVIPKDDDFPPSYNEKPTVTVTQEAITPMKIEVQPSLRIPDFSISPVTTTRAQSFAEEHRLSMAAESSPETVTVVWGKELFSPKSFNTFEVGPFTATATVRNGETRAEVFERLMRELEKFAEAERSKKKASFLAVLNEG